MKKVFFACGRVEEEEDDDGASHKRRMKDETAATKSGARSHKVPRQFAYRRAVFCCRLLRSNFLSSFFMFFFLFPFFWTWGPLGGEDLKNFLPSRGRSGW